MKNNTSRREEMRQRTSAGTLLSEHLGHHHRLEMKMITVMMMMMMKSMMMMRMRLMRTMATATATTAATTSTTATATRLQAAAPLQACRKLRARTHSQPLPALSPKSPSYRRRVLPLRAQPSALSSGTAAAAAPAVAARRVAPQANFSLARRWLLVSAAAPRPRSLQGSALASLGLAVAFALLNASAAGAAGSGNNTSSDSSASCASHSLGFCRLDLPGLYFLACLLDVLFILLTLMGSFLLLTMVRLRWLKHVKESRGDFDNPTQSTKRESFTQPLVVQEQLVLMTILLSICVVISFSASLMNSTSFVFNFFTGLAEIGAFGSVVILLTSINTEIAPCVPVKHFSSLTRLLPFLLILPGSRFIVRFFTPLKETAVTAAALVLFILSTIQFAVYLEVTRRAIERFAFATVALDARFTPEAVARLRVAVAEPAESPSAAALVSTLERRRREQEPPASQPTTLERSSIHTAGEASHATLSSSKAGSPPSSLPRSFNLRLVAAAHSHAASSAGQPHSAVADTPTTNRPASEDVSPRNRVLTTADSGSPEPQAPAAEPDAVVPAPEDGDDDWNPYPTDSHSKDRDSVPHGTHHSTNWPVPRLSSGTTLRSSQSQTFSLSRGDQNPLNHLIGRRDSCAPSSILQNATVVGGIGRPDVERLDSMEAARTGLWWLCFVFLGFLVGAVARAVLLAAVHGDASEAAVDGSFVSVGFMCLGVSVCSVHCLWWARCFREYTALMASAAAAV
ncbi:hypothetical protein DFJ73DRAFT_839938 [Zopfochytrium polystomum]|nr:hypothetical protein DFJ73DRAFT_839938 [Zopfochytrium polystomum]